MYQIASIDKEQINTNLPGGTYIQHQQEGFYNELESQLQVLDPDSSLMLGNLTYGIDFEACYYLPKYKGAFGKTLFKHITPGSSSEANNNSSQEMSLIMIGEVCPSAYRTALSAKGNYTRDSGPKPKPIDDKSTVKGVLVLRALTGAPNNSFIEDGFNNQLVTLREIMDAQAKEQSSDLTKKKCPLHQWRITEWLGDSQVPFLDPNDPKTSGHTPHQSASPVIKKKNLLTTKGKAKDGASLPTDKDNNTLSEGEDKEDESPAYGTLGALYDLNTLPDHWGNLFNHLKGHLVQNDIHDENNELIFPWDLTCNL
ncbi:hypothetical protein BJ165DRAFT_1572052 [Panaeolus papilionaceus]|nr:hypothetical protein BJ165DRAFT_1572052 [Panaeolus papilionaceus]